jgi:hypothetical protein
MLFLAAAREDQPAGETIVTARDASGKPKEVAQGAFTAALAQVLRSPAANQSVEQICNRVQAMLASEGSMQVPICAGSERESRGLLGQPVGMANSITLAVESVTGPNTLRFRGGSALGLAPGCTLVRVGSEKGSATLRAELVRVDLGISEGRLVDAPASVRVHPGDLFLLDNWVAAPQQALSVFFAKDGPATDSILAVARSLDRLARQKSIELVAEPDAANPPTHVLYWRAGTFRLERFPRAGETIHLGASLLGASPTEYEIAGQFAGSSHVRLWAILPPDRQTASNLRLGAGSENAAVQVVDDPANCLYLLAGRLNEEKLEYSWVFKDAPIASLDQVRLPLRTDWSGEPSQLTSLAVRLARIYGWLNLNGPAGGDPAFPYRLAFEKAGSGQTAGAGPFKFGERYKFVFVADPAALQQTERTGGVAKRYVYVFLIDSSGDAHCFFPRPENGNDSNLLPRRGPLQERIVATGDDHDVEIDAPAGTDNYFLVASEQPLDPNVFQWTGVRGTSIKRGAENPLEFLFNSVGEGTRGARANQSLPATWSIQSVAVRSVP